MRTRGSVCVGGGGGLNMTKIRILCTGLLKKLQYLNYLNHDDWHNVRLRWFGADLINL